MREIDRPAVMRARFPPVRLHRYSIFESHEKRIAESQSETSTSAIKHDRVDRDVRISNEDF